MERLADPAFKAACPHGAALGRATHILAILHRIALFWGHHLAEAVGSAARSDDARIGWAAIRAVTQVQTLADVFAPDPAVAGIVAARPHRRADGVLVVRSFVGYPPSRRLRPGAGRDRLLNSGDEVSKGGSTDRQSYRRVHPVHERSSRGSELDGFRNTTRVQDQHLIGVGHVDERQQDLNEYR